MPVQTRPPDQFTRDNLLLGFSTVEFEPALSGGGFGGAVELGILESEALQKEVELLELERGDAGTLTVDREIVSKLKPTLNIATFNLKFDVARYVFGSDIATEVTADAASAVTDDPVQAGTMAVRPANPVSAAATMLSIPVNGSGTSQPPIARRYSRSTSRMANR